MGNQKFSHECEPFKLWLSSSLTLISFRFSSNFSPSLLPLVNTPFTPYQSALVSSLFLLSPFIFRMFWLLFPFFKILCMVEAWPFLLGVNYFLKHWSSFSTLFLIPFVLPSFSDLFLPFVFSPLITLCSLIPDFSTLFLSLFLCWQCTALVSMCMSLLLSSLVYYGWPHYSYGNWLDWQ